MYNVHMYRHAHTHRSTQTHTCNHTYLYIYIYIYVNVWTPLNVSNITYQDCTYQKKAKQQQALFDFKSYWIGQRKTTVSRSCYRRISSLAPLCKNVMTAPHHWGAAFTAYLCKSEITTNHSSMTWNVIQRHRHVKLDLLDLLDLFSPSFWDPFGECRVSFFNVAISSSLARTPVTSSKHSSLGLPLRRALKTCSTTTPRNDDQNGNSNERHGYIITVNKH